MAFDLKDGNYKKAAFTVGSEVAFGTLGIAVDSAADPGKITKTDKAILNFVSEGWSRLTDFFMIRKQQTNEFSRLDGVFRGQFFTNP